MSKLFSSVQEIFLKELFFENNFFELFLYFWTSGVIFSDFRWKFFDSFVKTSFYVSSGDFWLDCFFYKNLWVFLPSSRCEEISVEFWRKSFKKVFLTAICVCKKFLSKIWYLKKKLFEEKRKYSGILALNL